MKKTFSVHSFSHVSVADSCCGHSFDLDLYIWTFGIAGATGLFCIGRRKAGEDPAGDEEGCQHHKSVTLVNFVSLVG